MAYLLDANVLIEAKNRYYGLDFCPAFWDWLIAMNLAGQVTSFQKHGVARALRLIREMGGVIVADEVVRRWSAGRMRWVGYHGRRQYRASHRCRWRHLRAMMTTSSTF